MVILNASRHDQRVPRLAAWSLGVGIVATIGADVAHGSGRAVAVSALAGQTDGVTAAQMELISADPRVMHGQAVLAGTRVPVSVILDCLAAGMTAEEIVAEYPVVTDAGIRAAAAYGAALAREELLPLPHAQ